RLEVIAKQAKEKGILYFTSTLTTSPHKDVDFIHQKGRELAEQHGLIYIPETFRTKDGFRRSVELSRQYGLYRQSYCGCRWSQHTINSLRNRSL
ncbi:MAG: epoxyqueuosine reductase QueH, partial [bacterium]